jgi:hypothetical protein
MKSFWLTDRLLQRLCLAYLFLPYFIFCVAWLSWPFAILFGGLGLFVFLNSWSLNSGQKEIDALFKNSKKKFIYIGVVFGVFIFFSGIGSYTFQNYDHLYRNAIFRDLVSHTWPVKYQVKGFPGHIFEGKETVMTYYMGFFLPAALLGKVLGFAFAKFFLLVWSFLGLCLCYLQVCRYWKSVGWKSLCLFLGWGTLFYIGALYKYPFREIVEEKSWLWAGMVLYADSNIGLVYYTFNQSLTAWLIIMIVVQGQFPRQMFFWYSICFFLSPFAFVGLAPFVLYYIFKDKGIYRVKDFISIENILGALSVLILTYVYLSNNKAGQFFQILEHRPKIFMVFMLLSWLGIAVWLGLSQFKNKVFWLVCLVLFPLPFFQQGYGIDFPGRISVPALFILMLIVGDAYKGSTKSWYKMGLVAYVLASAIPHGLLEVARSMYFSSAEYLAYHSTFAENHDLSKNDNLLDYYKSEVQQIRKKPVCTKDLGTLTNPRNTVIWNYMSATESSRYYKFLAPKPQNFNSND